MAVEGAEQIRKGVNTATWVLFFSCAAYIVALFQALPVSLHFQVSGTSIPTSISQFHLGMGLFTFRFFTFAFGEALGSWTDRCGRKPWLTGALVAYVPVYGAMIVTWYSRPRFEQDIPAGWTNVSSLSGAGLEGKVLVPCTGTPTYNFTEIAYGFELKECAWQPTIIAYYFCYVLLGIFTPYQPHAIGYVSDISPREDLPANQSWLGAFGFYLGLLFGFILALITYVLFGALNENQADGFKGDFIPASFVLAIIIVLIGIFMVNKIEESIGPELQAKNAKKAKCTDLIPCLGLVEHGSKNRYFMCVMGYFFCMSFGGGANEAIALTLFQRWFLVELGQRTTLMLFLVYAILSYLFNFIGAACTTSWYRKKCGFKNSFHVIFLMGLPTVLVMWLGLGKKDNSLAMLVVIWGVCITSTGPVVPFIATLFMGQSITDEDKGFYSGMFRSSQALGKALGAAVVASMIGPGWIASWKTSIENGTEHDDYWMIPIIGYMLPLLLSYGFFLLGEGCFVKEDRRGWEGKDAANGEMSLYVNCCAPGGLVTYQTGFEEKKLAKRRASSVSKA